MDRRQHASKSNAHRGAAATAGTSSAKQRKGKGGAGGGKKPIKVVYIGNPMRVTTSAAGFRALVQELTGRDADPSKYSGGGGAIDVIDADDSSGGSGSSLPAEPQPGALPSPGSTVESSDAAAAGVGNVPQADCWYDDGEDSFAPQLIDNRYCVFSPPTFL
ncbi:hypothetical protein ACP70R_034155 [Stipagrostis hirtigluma subsp. patula]